MSIPTSYPSLIVYEEQPLNAAPPLDLLCRSFITPQQHFFIRCHGTTPHIDPRNYRLTITGAVHRPLTLSLDELRSRFPAHTVTATLQCTGSRRNELAALRPIPDEILWGADPISTATWRGVLLREVLQTAGIGAEASYVAFTGLDEVQREGQQVGFGSSIRLEKAFSSETLLAYEMNDESLMPEHGFPLRVVVPGYIGARSVKWLRDITLQEHPSTNYFQVHAYKLFPPEVTEKTADWSRGKPIEEIPINSVICTPQEGTTLEPGPCRIQGYAITGEGSPIERVEVSIDGGQHWTTASIVARDNPWTWCFWKTILNLSPGNTEIIVRAWDTEHHTQPEDRARSWNLGGYANNAWHRVHIHVTL
jgi:sulfite oxidase